MNVYPVGGALRAERGSGIGGVRGAVSARRRGSGRAVKVGGWMMDDGCHVQSETARRLRPASDASEYCAAKSAPCRQDGSVPAAQRSATTVPKKERGWGWAEVSKRTELSLPLLRIPSRSHTQSVVGAPAHTSDGVYCMAARGSRRPEGEPGELTPVPWV